MKKIILIIMGTMVLTGCSYDNEPSIKEFNHGAIVYIDKATCVEYLRNIYDGGLSVRYNQDGTIKINEECYGK